MHEVSHVTQSPLQCVRDRFYVADARQVQHMSSRRSGYSADLIVVRIRTLGHYVQLYTRVSDLLGFKDSVPRINVRLTSGYDNGDLVHLVPVASARDEDALVQRLECGLGVRPTPWHPERQSVLYLFLRGIRVQVEKYSDVVGVSQRSDVDSRRADCQAIDGSADQGLDDGVVLNGSGIVENEGQVDDTRTLVVAVDPSVGSGALAGVPEGNRRLSCVKMPFEL